MLKRPVKTFPLSLMVVLALVSLACFAFPLYIIWPFRYQAPRELAVALFVTQIGPWVSVACAAICFILLFWFWSRNGWKWRSIAALTTVLACAGVLLSRINIYEKMFHPLGTPQFEAARTAQVDADDMVIAVSVNGVRRAYPIREMAYHHVVNDTVGRKPIVATY